jgi:hypothetical protein
MIFGAVTTGCTPSSDTANDRKMTIVGRNVLYAVPTIEDLYARSFIIARVKVEQLGPTYWVGNYNHPPSNGFELEMGASAVHSAKLRVLESIRGVRKGQIVTIALSGPNPVNLKTTYKGVQYLSTLAGDPIRVGDVGVAFIRPAPKEKTLKYNMQEPYALSSFRDAAFLRPEAGKFHSRVHAKAVTLKQIRQEASQRMLMFKKL